MKLEKLLACLKKLNFHPKVENFEHRLIIQKTACLLDLLDFDIGYKFSSLYIRGPYCTDLSHDLYENKEAVNNLRTSASLSESEKIKLAKINEISDGLNSTMLEIMSTYAFLSKRCNKEEKEAIVELKRLKPFFSEAHIAVGVSRVKQLFVPSEKEIASMKKEFGALEQAAVSDQS